MRRGEILQQRWEDLDFFRRILAVTKSKTAEGEAREIPLSTRLFELLKAKPQNKGLIFLYGERPIQAIKTAWRTAVRKSGIRSFRFKDLRSTFNSRLIEAGVIKDVRKELMGHSRNEDTNDLYSHIELPLLREAIAKLDAWHNDQLTLLEKEVNGKPDGGAADRSDAGSDAERGAVACDPVTGPSQSDTAEKVPAGIQ
jgi:integrase